MKKNYNKRSFTKILSSLFKRVEFKRIVICVFLALASHNTMKGQVVRTFQNSSFEAPIIDNLPPADIQEGNPGGPGTPGYAQILQANFPF